MHLCSFIIYLHLGMIVACSCLARIQWLLRSHHPPGHSTASSDTKCMHEEFHSWMCWVMLCIFDWFWVSCSIVFVPLYCAAFVKWAQAKPPHTVVCWCLSDPGLYRLVKWVKCMWKILKDCTWRNLYSMIILYANVSNLWFGLDSWIQFGKAAVAGIACLGVLIGLCIVRDVPRLGEQKWNAERCISCSSCCVYLFENQTRTPSISKYLQVLRTCKLFDSWARLRLPRSTGIDSARGLSCRLLFLVGQAMETWKHGKTWNDGKTCVFSSFDFRQVAIAEFLVGVTSQASSHWDSHRKMAESHSSLEQFEHKDVPVKPIKLKIAQSWEYPQDSQDPARKRLRFYWFTGFTLSSQRSRSWRNPGNLRALKVLVLLLLSSPWVTSPVEFDARTTILM